MNLYELVVSGAERFGDAAAIGTPGGAGLSFRRLLELTESTGRKLGELGLAGGERVALVTCDGPQMAAAAVTMGAFVAVAPLHSGYSEREMRSYLEDLDPTALLVWHGINSPAVAVARELGLRVIVLQAGDGSGWFDMTDLGRFPAGGHPCPPAGDDATALVLPTSGTTGRSKVVLLSHRSVCWSGRNVASTLELSPDDRCLNVVPLSTVHGLISCLLGPLCSGGSTLCAGFDAARFHELVSTSRATWYSVGPTVLRFVLAQAPPGSRAKIPHLRFIRYGSASVSAELASAVEERFGVPVIGAYGLTESGSQVTSNRLPPGVRKHGSVGFAAPEMVRVVLPDGTDAGIGVGGEVLVSGPGVMSGYLNDEAATRESLNGGWFHTGDSGYLDADRYLYLTGRSKETINRGGEKVSPDEVDLVLSRHPAVREVATFAVPHDTLGEDVAAAVVLKPDATSGERDIRDFAFEHLAGFKVPSHIVVVDEIPVGPTGKFQRTRLAEKLAPGLRMPFVPPARGTQQSLASIWEEVLGKQGVGANDNFFMLGGDSITATIVVARIRERIGTEVPLPWIFREPTLRGQAESILRIQVEALPPGALEKYLAELAEMSDEDAERSLGDGGNTG